MRPPLRERRRALHHSKLPKALIAPPTSEATAPPTGAFSLGSSFIDGQGPAFHLKTIERRHRSLRFVVVRHFDESEPLGPAGLSVHDDLSAPNRAVRCKHLFQSRVRNTVGQIAYVQLLAHEGLQRKQTGKPRTL